MYVICCSVDIRDSRKGCRGSIHGISRISCEYNAYSSVLVLEVERRKMRKVRPQGRAVWRAGLSETFLTLKGCLSKAANSGLVRLSGIYSHCLKNDAL